jgi:hypothetical protein
MGLRGEIKDIVEIMADELGYVIGFLIDCEAKTAYAPYRQHYQRPEISFNKTLNTAPIRYGLKSRYGINCQR